MSLMPSIDSGLMSRNASDTGVSPSRTTMLASRDISGSPRMWRSNSSGCTLSSTSSSGTSREAIAYSSWSMAMSRISPRGTTRSPSAARSASSRARPERSASASSRRCWYAVRVRSNPRASANSIPGVPSTAVVVRASGLRAASTTPRRRGRAPLRCRGSARPRRRRSRPPRDPCGSCTRRAGSGRSRRCCLSSSATRRWISRALRLAREPVLDPGRRSAPGASTSTRRAPWRRAG